MYQKLLNVWLVLVLFTANGQLDSDLEEVYSHLKAMEGYCNTGQVIKAGVKIGTGIRLGHQTLKGLQNMGISSALTEKLKPFLGLQSSKEIEEAHLDPKNLELSDEEIKHLDLRFLQNSINIAKPYSKYLDKKGLSVLISLRCWTGRLKNSNPDGKLTLTKDGKVVNYVWDAMKNKKVTNRQLQEALTKTLTLQNGFSTAYDRIHKEILYLTS